MSDAAAFAPAAAVERGHLVRRRLTTAGGKAAFWVHLMRWRLATTDAVVVVIVVATATAVGFVIEPAVMSASKSEYAVVALLTAISWLSCIAVAHTRDERVLGMGAVEYRRVASSTVLEFGILALIVLVADFHMPRTFVLVALPLGLVALLLERWLWRKWLLRQRRMGRYLTPAIVAARPPTRTTSCTASASARTSATASSGSPRTRRITDSSMTAARSSRSSPRSRMSRIGLASWGRRRSSSPAAPRAMASSSES